MTEYTLFQTLTVILSRQSNQQTRFVDILELLGQSGSGSPPSALIHRPVGANEKTYETNSYSISFKMKFMMLVKSFITIW